RPAREKKPRVQGGGRAKRSSCQAISTFNRKKIDRLKSGRLLAKGETIRCHLLESAPIEGPFRKSQFFRLSNWSEFYGFLRKVNVR
ncbi:hypothetical protein, partial [Massilia genomosp. 1]|uniref:hypothetical protein n=1 Tax=Massilia genomosp. 1 TaxID=2609280 RepID=UPI001C9E8A28